jgi:thymidylate synthase ThyX
MKEREFKKLVFENFVQAKKELIREGYIKKTDNLNFEDVFNETKKKVLEERVKSLQRENQMLKKQLSKKKRFGRSRYNDCCWNG